ncbi:TetR/AcrR family transcriptional regulator [Oerskovia sp. NPDC060287]|uniref:TetR/AcrR family transcriptional regulator n=1 Tax=Oerskovia sp. NPDC060287 TaxID=3347095 RepID=UPI0036579C75
MSNNSEASRLSPDERREQILRVASERFAREGFDAVSVRDIAQEAGVTRALVYHYFPGKDSLLDAVLRREAEAILMATSPLPGRSARENLERALGAYLDHFSASSGQLRDLYAPHASAPALVHELAAANHVVQVERILDYLDLADTTLSRLAVGGWLGFVEEVARESGGGSSVPREQVLGLCLRALGVVTGSPLVLGSGEEDSIEPSTRENNS